MLNLLVSFTIISLFFGCSLTITLWIQIAKRREKLLNYMLFLRVTPTLPNLFINLASPIVDIPFHIFFSATLLGLIPAAYITVRVSFLKLIFLFSSNDYYVFVYLHTCTTLSKHETQIVANAYAGFCESFALPLCQELQVSIHNDYLVLLIFVPQVKKCCVSLIYMGPSYQLFLFLLFSNDMLPWYYIGNFIILAFISLISQLQ